MGFVLLEDDQQCTLEAVLAFLDEDEELHHGTSSDSNSDYPPTSPEREEVTTGATAATTGWIQIPQRPVVSSEPKSSRATRDETVRTNQRSKAVARRQQIESILVRNEVHELEKVLRKLQRAHETRKRNSKWYRVALAQAQERYKSETLNRKLKNAVAKRLSSSQLLQEAFVISATSE
uniref:Uncharacterized protein n=1 Tax=Globisporangium ultimum (strain ATCC 200006 / CBS 805.95 / DAOM BR144) TaxID=431595 RepID=K3W8R4_GLOUD